jgi:sortase (surface protein transpeptidase)
MLKRLKPGGDHRLMLSVVATGSLLLALLLLASGGSDAVLPRGVVGEDHRLSLPAATVQEAEEQAADPVRIRIPVIGVDAPVDPLEVDENAILSPPETNDGTGWWRDGPEPGERGPAVIAGHVDSYQGPAVFFRLTELRPGDRIFVDRADGTAAVFVIKRIEQHGKDTFPTEAVYGDTPDAQLRLITCGGDFDEDERSYLDNIIVYALRAG